MRWTNKTLAFALGWRQVLCSLPVSAHEGPSLAQMFTFFPSLCLLTTVSAPHFKLVVVMQRCLQIRTRCVINERFCLWTAHCDWDTVCILNVTLTNFETKRRGRKIGSIWLRPFKSCTNNLHSPAVWAIPLCSEGREKETERYSWVQAQESVKRYSLRGRKHVYSNLPDLTPHCRSDTFLPYPTRVFSPAGRKSPQLLPISSQGTGTPTSPTASLRQTLLSQLQRQTALQRKLEPEERS